MPDSFIAGLAGRWLPMRGGRSTVLMALVGLMGLAFAACGDLPSETEWTVDEDSAATPAAVARPVADIDPVENVTTTTTTEAVDDSFERWQAESAAVCDDFAAETAQLIEDLNNLDPEDDFGAALDAMVPLNERFLEAALAVEVPTNRSDHVEELYRRYARQHELIVDAGYAASRGDLIQVLRLLRDLDQEALELATALLRMDLGVCVGANEATTG